MIFLRNDLFYLVLTHMVFLQVHVEILGVINYSFMLKLQTDGSNKYTDHLDGAFIVWLSIVINK